MGMYSFRSYIKLPSELLGLMEMAFGVDVRLTDYEPLVFRKFWKVELMLCLLSNEQVIDARSL